jgi:hypothetical protein
MQKIIKDVNKYLQTQGSGPWPQNRLSALDRATGELLRLLEKKVRQSSIWIKTCCFCPIAENVLLSDIDFLQVVCLSVAQCCPGQIV